eukprot:gnl/TRDRNA2_/TRDRNA2_180975_c0_seq1.p1 gnl/TRDRNA2_/TRDRNA2_180975_c0~~gnl/TRDRNA2_/TRDRNA2_180975_c0_seq1.p1  ORF type:complete len:179 (-),score=29.97 gnl/TRDRNA2_/TRDRNA2_180975_c0_seq1:132-668(-)
MQAFNLFAAIFSISTIALPEVVADAGVSSFVYLESDDGGPQVSLQERLAPLHMQNANSSSASDDNPLLTAMTTEEGHSPLKSAEKNDVDFFSDNLVPALLIMSFMMLRLTVALNTTCGSSAQSVWKWILVACVTRCIAEGVSFPTQLGDIAVLIMIVIRESMHAWGLRIVLRNFPTCC